MCVISSPKDNEISKMVELCLISWEIGNLCIINVDNAS